MYIRLGRPMRKHGGYEYCMINKMRNTFTSINMVIRPIIEQNRANFVIMYFLKDSLSLDTLVEKGG